MRAHRLFAERFLSKRSPYYILCGLIGVFVCVNIIASYTFPPLMYQVMEGDPTSTAQYLKKIQGTPLFNAEMQTVRDEQNAPVLSEIARTTDQQKTQIAHLQSVIAAYPYAPEPYYNLSLVYTSENNSSEALRFLQKAQALDPAIR
jgi:hypothetical protein